MKSTNYTETANQSISVTVIYLSLTRVKYFGAAVLQLIALQCTELKGETCKSFLPFN